MNSALQTIKWWVFGFLCSGIALYAFAYFAAYFSGIRVGILDGGKSEELMNSTLWNIGFYSHVGFGGIALLVGWTQFSKKLRKNRIKLHRILGKVYVVCGLLSAAAGIYIGYYASGGIIAQVGFIGLGITWFSTTLMAYVDIRRMHIDQHERMMIYSYAACLAAVSLRIFLPLLIISFGEFLIAYRIVAWLCWVPNMIVAWIIVRRKKNLSYQVG